MPSNTRIDHDRRHRPRSRPHTTREEEGEDNDDPDRALRLLLHWVNSLPGASPRCLLASQRDDLLADGGRAVVDLILLLLPPRAKATGAELDLATALETLVCVYNRICP